MNRSREKLLSEPIGGVRERPAAPTCWELFSEMLRKVEGQFFKPVPDGVIEGAAVCEGVVFRSCDGSFEDRLFHEGVPYTACTETPGKLDLSLRIKANRQITEAFIEFLPGQGVVGLVRFADAQPRRHR